MEGGGRGAPAGRSRLALSSEERPVQRPWGGSLISSKVGAQAAASPRALCLQLPVLRQRLLPLPLVQVPPRVHTQRRRLCLPGGPRQRVRGKASRGLGLEVWRSWVPPGVVGMLAGRYRGMPFGAVSAWGPHTQGTSGDDGGRDRPPSALGASWERVWLGPRGRSWLGEVQAAGLSRSRLQGCVVVSSPQVAVASGPSEALTLSRAVGLSTRPGPGLPGRGWGQGRGARA